MQRTKQIAFEEEQWNEEGEREGAKGKGERRKRDGKVREAK